MPPGGPRPGEPSASPTAEAAKIACPKQALPKALSMGATSQPRKYSRVLASLCSHCGEIQPNQGKRVQPPYKLHCLPHADADLERLYRGLTGQSYYAIVTSARQTAQVELHAMV
ncbi:hypothetical protein N7519_000332 [Penicillium mononematosum]|uniref:uncharacterized protein n=1 Tax=Penicillium mononematosum TaxID=268346 RepID=UPI00254875DE|nr:uncharacterized protein N7519_000332 [Penicillium mononematosum]KAJ6190311.1 hypothetical protein N7519_000332 [Penicillium mononematosum]